MAGLDRISSHLDTKGKNKRARSAKEKKELGKKLARIGKGYENIPGLTQNEDLEAEPPQPKKRRLNADHRIVLAPLNCF